MSAPMMPPESGGQGSRCWSECSAGGADQEVEGALLSTFSGTPPQIATSARPVCTVCESTGNLHARSGALLFGIASMDAVSLLSL